MYTENVHLGKKSYSDLDDQGSTVITTLSPCVDHSGLGVKVWERSVRQPPPHLVLNAMPDVDISALRRMESSDRWA